MKKKWCGFYLVLAICIHVSMISCTSTQSDKLEEGDLVEYKTKHGWKKDAKVVSINSDGKYGLIFSDGRSVPSWPAYALRKQKVASSAPMKPEVGDVVEYKTKDGWKKDAKVVFINSDGKYELLLSNGKSIPSWPGYALRKQQLSLNVKKISPNVEKTNNDETQKNHASNQQDNKKSDKITVNKKTDTPEIGDLVEYKTKSGWKKDAKVAAINSDGKYKLLLSNGKYIPAWPVRALRKQKSAAIVSEKLKKGDFVEYRTKSGWKKDAKMISINSDGTCKIELTTGKIMQKWPKRALRKQISDPSVVTEIGETEKVANKDSEEPTNRKTMTQENIEEDMNNEKNDKTKDKENSSEQSESEKEESEKKESEKKESEKEESEKEESEKEESEKEESEKEESEKEEAEKEESQKEESEKEESEKEESEKEESEKEEAEKQKSEKQESEKQESEKDETKTASSASSEPEVGDLVDYKTKTGWKKNAKVVSINSDGKYKLILNNGNVIPSWPRYALRKQQLSPSAKTVNNGETQKKSNSHQQDSETLKDAEKDQTPIDMKSESEDSKTKDMKSKEEHIEGKQLNEKDMQLEKEKTNEEGTVEAVKEEKLGKEQNQKVILWFGIVWAAPFSGSFFKLLIMHVVLWWGIHSKSAQIFKWLESKTEVNKNIIKNNGPIERELLPASSDEDIEARYAVDWIVALHYLISGIQMSLGIVVGMSSIWRHGVVVHIAHDTMRIIQILMDDKLSMKLPLGKAFPQHLKGMLLIQRILSVLLGFLGYLYLYDIPSARALVLLVLAGSGPFYFCEQILIASCDANDKLHIFQALLSTIWFFYCRFLFFVPAVIEITVQAQTQRGTFISIVATSILLLLFFFNGIIAKIIVSEIWTFLARTSKDNTFMIARRISAAAGTFNQPSSQFTFYSKIDLSMASELHSKMEGPNKQALANYICSKNFKEIATASNEYKSQYNQNLIDDIKKYCSDHNTDCAKSNFHNCLIALCTPQPNYDATLLKNAMDETSIDTNLLIEIMCTRTKDELKEISQTYTSLFHENLIARIRDCYKSPELPNLFEIFLNEDAKKSSKDINQLKIDVTKMHDWINKVGVDQNDFFQICAGTSRDYVKSLFSAYEKEYHKKLDAVIEPKFSETLQKAILCLVKPNYKTYAKKLHEAMKGISTDEETLIRIIVTQRERELGKIVEHYLTDYKVTLESSIKKEVSEDIQKTLLVLLPYEHDLIHTEISPEK